MNISQWMTQGQVLGAQVYRDSALIVQGVLDSRYRESLTSHDLEILALAVGVVALLGLGQLVGVIRRYRQTNKGELGRWVGLIVMDLALLMILIAVHIYWDYQVVKIEEPRNVQVERLGAELVRVQWQTFDDTLGILAWRYAGESEEKLITGEQGTVGKKEHEVLIEVEPGKELYFYLIVGNKRYGATEQSPYHVDAQTKTYELKEIKTNVK